MIAQTRETEGDAAVDPSLERAITQARGSGRALDLTVRRQMEQAFGSDFGGVRVHTGAQAHSLNKTLNAVAFATGQDIFFRDSAYDPGSRQGRELLAHELTHVVQQGGGAVKGKLVLGATDDPYEREADAVSRVVVAGLESNTAPPIHRQCACGASHAESGGECAGCRQQREAVRDQRPDSAGGHVFARVQRQDDGGVTDGGSLPGGVPTPPSPEVGSSAAGGASANPCVDQCEKQFNDCLNPPWWQFWKTPNPNQCLADRQACLRNCPQSPPVHPQGCGEGLCEPGPGCEACCQFFCPDNYSECTSGVCSPYR
jgi:Domain of unknown function (DUF4157)